MKGEIFLKERDERWLEMPRQTYLQGSADFNGCTANAQSKPMVSIFVE